MEITKRELGKTNRQNVVKCKNPMESQETYTGWSKKYDEELDALNYQSPQYAAKMFGKNSHGVKAVLDIGTGTGKAAELIRKKYGYEGVFDLLDANLGMLVQADKKGLNIRNIIRHWVDQRGELPVKDESYDVITCTGSFGPNHISVTALPGMVKSLKHGGLFIMTAGIPGNDSYHLEFHRFLQNMIDAKEVELVEKEEYQNFPNALDEVVNVVLVLKRS
ncbi:ubiquinone/menaquinone biosynthesis C-methyltransferase UbiE-like isoform X3 [Clavelina lepadiformis]|uniref:ubiquinone/menaquinone biosynthesis C-methyltransferase UbiE-like isoform X3 n=1 Tax=Clavelina lepadiformis TaxID=159417 RepID=UPI0040438AB9